MIRKVQKTSYFCTVKHFNTFLKTVLLTFLVSLTCVTCRATESADSVDIALLTCGPGDEVYSLYGHTAIRYTDHRTGEDMVINYGMFSFNQDYFVLRFVFGLTDYQMGITPFDYFMREYQYEGRWVYQQTLNLTAEQKRAIGEALAHNYLPENRTYRYNFFYNNCTTKARDVIVGQLGCDLEYPQRTLDGVTFRTMLHQWNEDYPWSRLGNDLLLGVKADRQVSMAERQFLPDSLREDFEDAYLRLPSGERRKLVSVSRMLYAPSLSQLAEKQDAESGFAAAVPPMAVALAVLMVMIVVTIIEWRTRRILYGLDILWLLATGVGGIILTAMIFSQHPTVSLNFQILILSPLCLVALWPVVRSLRRRQFGRWLWVIVGSLALSLFMGIWQKYDASIWTLALSLLFRVAVLYNWCKRTKQTTA